MITTNGIGPIKAGAFLTITGTITREEFVSLNTTPHVILPAIGGTYVVHSCIISLNWTVRATNSLALGYAPLVNLYGVLDGSISYVRLGTLPNAGYFTMGPPFGAAAANASTGAPLVWITENDEPAADYEDCFYQIFYSIVNPV